MRHLINPKNLIYIATLLLAGCAATGPLFIEHPQPTQQESRIYLYRPYRVTAQGGGPAVEIDGKQFGTLLNKGYVVTYVPPGEHQISAKGNIFNWAFPDLDVKINTRGGGTQYLRLTPEFLGAGAYLPGYVSTKFREHIEIVDEAVGRSEIAECRRVEP